jgi:phospholipid/cholesterol/gamma-HCH transport system ATP-binding protein
MSILLQFNQAELAKLDNLSFSISSGECKILQVPSPEAKTALIEMTVGESIPVKGVVLFHGQTLDTCKLGSIGWIPAGGGLISNLKAWENITLPLWFHNSRQRKATEETLKGWLIELKLDKQDWEKFMASPAARLKTWECKMAGLLRGLIQAPQLLVIDAALFDEVDEFRIQTWTKALEKFVQEANDRAALVIACGDIVIPWDKIRVNEK